MQRVTNTKSFTLVETIMVIVILGIIAAVGVPLILSASDALSFLTVRSEMAQSTDVAMSRILHEIRRIRDDQSIVAVGDIYTEFRFFIDINNDGDGTNDIDIHYYRSGTDLMRVERDNIGSIISSNSLASNVNSLTFTYYDENGGVLSPPTVGIGTTTDIDRIKILLTFQNGAYDFDCQSQVRPRNLE